MTEETAELVAFISVNLASLSSDPFFRERWLQSEAFSMHTELKQSPKSKLQSPKPKSISTWPKSKAEIRATNPKEMLCAPNAM